MGATAANPNRFLRDIAGANTPLDMIRPTFGGEILMAFRESRILGDKVMTKTINTGYEAQFPQTWKFGSGTHEAGATITGFPIATRQRSIFLDERPIFTAFELDEVDERVADFSVRSEFTAQLGETLANREDEKVAKAIVLAAREVDVAPFPSGGVITDAIFNNEDAAAAQLFLASLKTIIVDWDVKDVPVPERYACVTPGLFQELRDLPSVIPAYDITSTVGVPQSGFFGHNDFDPSNPQIAQFIDRGFFVTYNGIKIYRSNHLPNGEIDTSNTPQAGDYSDTKAIVWQKMAVATVTKRGIALESERDMKTQSDMTLATLHIGAGTMRPVCAFEIKGT